MSKSRCKCKVRKTGFKNGFRVGVTYPRQKHGRFKKGRFGHHSEGRDINALLPGTFKSGDLARAPGEEPADNLLNKDASQNDVLFQVPYDEDQGLTEDDFVYLIVDNVSYEADGVLAGPVVKDIEVTLRQPWRALNGQHIVQYVYRFDSGGGNKAFGPTQTFIVDTVAPGVGGLAAAELGFDTRSEALTSDKLNPAGGLDVHIYGYGFMAKYDWIWLMIDGKQIDPPFVLETVPRQDESVIFSIPAATLEALAEGKHTLSYKVQDRAGWDSPESAPLEFTNLLDSGIDDLEPLIVWNRDGDPIEDVFLDDIQYVDGSGKVGIRVAIPNHVKYVVGSNYQLKLWLDDQESAPVTIVPNVGADPILEIVFPYTYIYAWWRIYSAALGDNFVPADVFYRIYVDGFEVGEAPTTHVIVNLDAAGEEDPDPETPENETLNKPYFISASGEMNQVPLRDFGRDGEVFVPTRTNTTPARAAFKEGDRLEIYFRKKGTDTPFYQVTHDPVTAAEAAGTDPIVETMLGDELKKIGTGVMDLFYEAYRVVVPGDPTAPGGPIPPVENRSISPGQDVPVMGPDELPGDGGPLAEPVWKEGPRDPLFGGIGACDARDIVTFVVPGDYSNRKQGDEVTFKLDLYPTFNHKDDETVIPGRFYKKSATVGSPGTPIEFTFNESELMFYGETPLTMHAHVHYEILGKDQQGGSDPGVPSNELILKVDSRGDRPERCDPRTDSLSTASHGDCGCGSGHHTPRTPGKR